ncbi:P-loop containing nucleoside triphosphate hydrolase protein [Pholiota molesta]|nr:P-loop containing nucleoside triphosphate hydrolase protein [Pholiota molesta]
MPETSRESTFKFSSPEGWHLCRRIIAQRLPYGPHDYQLSGITAVLDGIDMLAISATGSGKLAYIYMLMHIILGIVESPELCPMAKFPKDPAILVIYPTTALEEDQEFKMRELGLTAKAVNSVTKAEEDKNGANIWKLVESKISVILLSPKMLTSPGFGYLLESKTFQSRLCTIAVDEVHLLATWGDRFRPSFRQIGFMRPRFSRHIVMFALTATLQPKHLPSICRQLGFHDGKYHLVRRSNARLVIGTGNPRVPKVPPVPLPSKTRTRAYGYGFSRVWVEGYGGYDGSRVYPSA